MAHNNISFKDSTRICEMHGIRPVSALRKRDLGCPAVAQTLSPNLLGFGWDALIWQLVRKILSVLSGFLCNIPYKWLHVTLFLTCLLMKPSLYLIWQNYIALNIMFFAYTWTIQNDANNANMWPGEKPLNASQAGITKIRHASRFGRVPRLIILWSFTNKHSQFCSCPTHQHKHN